MSKTCSGCGKTKQLDGFVRKSRNKDGRASRCRECSRAAVKGHYDRNGAYYRKKQKLRNKEIKEIFKKIVSDVKSVPCVDCRISFKSFAMDFDHVRGEKKFIISRAANSTSQVKVLLEEIAKCDVVCAVCHRYRTFAPVA